MCGTCKSAHGTSLNILCGAACHDRLPACIVRKDTCKQSVCLFDSHCSRPDHDQLAHGTDDRVFCELEAGAHNDRNKYQEYSHRDNCCEHRERLDYKGCEPLLELAPVIKGGDRYYRRCDYVQKQQIEYSHYTVHNYDSHIYHNGDAHQIDKQIVHSCEGNIEILIDLIQVINALIACIIRCPHIIQHIRIFIEGIVLCGGVIAYAHSSAEEKDTVQRHFVFIILTSPVVLLKSMEAIIVHKDLLAVIESIGNTFLVFIHRLLLIEIRSRGQLLKNRLPGVFILAVFLTGIVVIKNSCIGEIFQIRSDLIIAGVQIIPVIA